MNCRIKLSTSYTTSYFFIFRDVVKDSLDNTKESRQDTLDDAVGIYNKFVSMEAFTPLGFSSIVRYDLHINKSVNCLIKI